MFIGVNWLIEADSMTLETARSIPWYPFCLVLEIANLEIAWAKISWIVGSCAKRWCVCVCVCGVHLNLNAFCSHIFPVGQITDLPRISLCMLHLGRLLSLLILNRCGMFFTGKQFTAKWIRHSSSESFTSIRSKLPWEKQSICWATCTESRIISLSGPKSTNLQGTSPWYSLNADQRHAL